MKTKHFEETPYKHEYNLPARGESLQLKACFHSKTYG